VSLYRNKNRATLLQTMMSTINPFIGNWTTTKISTPVISMTVNRCVNSKRRRRRSATATGLSPGSSIVWNRLTYSLPNTPLDQRGATVGLIKGSSIVLNKLTHSLPKSVAVVDVIKHWKSHCNSTSNSGFQYSGGHQHSAFCAGLAGERNTKVRKRRHRHERVQPNITRQRASSAANHSC